MFRKPIEMCSAHKRSHVLEPDSRFVCVIDQFDAQPFNNNDAGWIRNDISQLARATSQSQYDALMRRLVEIKAEGGIKEGTSVEEAISQIKPRYAQSPNEIEQFIQMTNGDVMKKLDEAYQKSLSEVKADTSKVDTPPAVES